MRRDPEQTIGRVAHALDPAAWTKRWLIVGLVALAGVLSVTVLQRALVADSRTEWLITGVHGAVVAVIVPLLSIRTVREWRARRADQLSMGAPE